MSELIPQPLRPLLGGEIPSELPTAVPIDLAELPIVRASKALRYDENRQLAEECLVVEGALEAGRHRMRYRIRSANPTVPLPYGADGEVLYAVLEMIAEEAAWQSGRVGRLDGVTFARFADVLGLEDTGHLNNRIREALTRLANTVITTEIVQPDEARDVLDGQAEPSLPRQRKRTTESVLHLLSVSYTHEQETIDYIQLDPTWIYQAASGWTAWIDLSRFVALSSPVAQRLYSLAAVQCARGRYEWNYSQEDLSALCGLSPGTPDREHRRTLKSALSTLIEGRVLSAGVIEKERPGKYRCEMTAGPALTTARLLRGAGMTDLRDTRIQLVLLGAIGITGSVARKIITEAPDDAYWALYYYRWTVETHPESEQVQDPARFLLWAVREGRNLSADQRFYRWFLRQTGEVEEEPAAPAKTFSPPPAPSEPEPLPEGLWGDVLVRARERLPAAEFRSWVASTRLAEETDTVVTIHAPSAFAAEWVRSRYQDLLEEILSEVRGGRSTVLKVETAPAT